MRSIDDSFYKTKLWEDTREAYLKKRRYICERCGEPAVIVHHRQYLNSNNVNEDSIAYGEDNLEALCLDCHNLEHGKVKRRFVVDGSGRVAPRKF